MSLTTLETRVAESIPPKTLQAAMALTPQADQDLILAALDRVLRAMQRANQLRSFGQCKTCRHHLLEADGGRRCGLTGEVLKLEEGEKICREHEAPAMTMQGEAGW